MVRRRILVVEDNRDNMMLVADILQSLDYDVLVAVDGQQGLEVATSEKPDLILLDLSLPMMDGWTVARTLKTTQTAQHIPIIAITAHAFLGDRDRALAAGCDEYLSKPINLGELKTALARFLG